MICQFFFIYIYPPDNFQKSIPIVVTSKINNAAQNLITRAYLQYKFVEAVHRIYTIYLYCSRSQEFFIWKGLKKIYFLKDGEEILIMNWKLVLSLFYFKQILALTFNTSNKTIHLQHISKR